MSGHQKNEEKVASLINMPAEKRRQDNAVAEAGDRKKFCQSLEKSEYDGLKIGQHNFFIVPFSIAVVYNIPIMSTKTLVWVGLAIGSTVGSCLPMLWGGSLAGMSSVLWGAVGGIAGLYGGFKMGQYF
jgi:hypothetical protein